MKKRRTIKNLFILFLTLSLFFISCKGSTSASTDITAPSAVEISFIYRGNDSVMIQWTMPTESDFSYVKISYSDTSLTTTEPSSDICNLSSETEYTFTLVSVDTSGNESENVSLTFSTGDSTTKTSLTPIKTAEDLYNIRDDLDDGYILINDIDLSVYSSGWTPIGDGTNPFSGILFGNNSVVSNLTINSTANFQGLFGYTSGATISQLALENLNVDGGDFTGGLVGNISTSGTISDCYATGTVSGDDTGGLVGYLASGGTISDCYFDEQTTGCNDTEKGVPKSTTEMKTITTYSGWDFTTTWDIDSDTNGINDGYPYLQDNEPSE